MKRAINIIFLKLFCVQAIFAQDILSINDQLLIAAFDGDSVRVEALLEKGADVNYTTYEGVTPLMFAAQNGFTGIAGMLVSKGARVNTRADDGNTALILAIMSGYIETAEFLIRNGADVDLPDGDGISPLMHAIKVDTFYFPDMLLYYGADVEHKDNMGENALMLASYYGNFEIAIGLLEGGADINEADKDGNTPLHYATLGGNTDIMELLIINGASVDIKNNRGYTPLSVAVATDKYDEALVLISYGADVNTRIQRTVNPLSLAIRNRNEPIKRLLLNHDAESISSPDFNLFTTGSTVAFNKDDSRLSFGLGLSDSRFFWMPELSYGFRPTAIQVLEGNDTSLYQYWERRHFIAVSVNKGFLVRSFGPRLKTGAYAGLGGVLTFGSYRGSSSDPAVRFLLNPAAGCMAEYHPFRIKAGFEYMNLQLRYYNNWWFAISLQVLINTRRSDTVFR